MEGSGGRGEWNVQVFSILHETTFTKIYSLAFLKFCTVSATQKLCWESMSWGSSTHWWVLRSEPMFPKTVLMNSSPSSPLGCRKVARGFW